MNFLEGYKVGRLLWLVYFKQSTWSWLDVENLQRWRRSAVTGKKILRLTSPPVPIWFLIIDPIPIFTLMCAPLTWLANKYSSTQTLTRYRPARKQAPGLAWLDSRVQERQCRQPRPRLVRCRFSICTVFEYCSNFVCICKLLSKYWLIKLKRFISQSSTKLYK